MSALAGRRVVLGVTGGIAAYKAIEVCRRLVDAGAHVVPVMTRGAQRFIGPTTLSALASEPVKTSLWDEADPIPHTRLGQSADLVLVVPATARLLGTYAAGISSDLLTATLLATQVLAPGDLRDRRVLVTAGGTREPLDPVRFIGNRSSGKQGHALADEAAARGASVTLVTTANRPVAVGVDVVRVET